MTNNNDEERSPAWSPDGKQIALTCKINGSPLQACVMNADGSNLRAVTTKNGRTVVWSPDGKSLIFHREAKFDDTEDEQLFSIDLDGTNEKQITFGSHLNGWANPGMIVSKKR